MRGTGGHCRAATEQQRRSLPLLPATHKPLKQARELGLRADDVHFIGVVLFWAKFWPSTTGGEGNCTTRAESQVSPRYRAWHLPSSSLKQTSAPSALSNLTIHKLEAAAAPAALLRPAATVATRSLRQKSARGFQVTLRMLMVPDQAVKRGPAACWGRCPPPSRSQRSVALHPPCRSCPNVRPSPAVLPGGPGS